MRLGMARSRPCATPWKRLGPPGSGTASDTPPTPREHCTICPADLQARLAKLRMVAVMQPMAARYGRVASALFFPARDRKDLAAHGPLIKAGVAVAFSSDLPVSTDPNPWPGIRAAVEDQVNGVGMLAALRAYTVGGAYASFEEGSKGTLEP